MRKYKDVIKDHYGIFIKTTCPCCGEILIIKDDEFNRILYKPVEKLSNTIVINKETGLKHIPKPYIGSSDYTKDEYEYICCNCNKTNRISNEEYTKNRCNVLGNNNIIFELNSSETQKVIDFKKQYKDKLSENWFNRKVDAMGMEYEYRIIPGGLGHLVYVKNTTTGEEICVSNTDNW